ncbi:hypothetical protein EAI30_08560 [Romboutsia ilealis]|uniref:Uncharacterized protein n=1 Tax=Romboutsia faecis TaxID=2764597 RepID=A0ABR7JPJ4_9FIRM|nr:hypothetical protein [Romboutsia faecis]MBC5996828.1 hypothetical protein [Romboutsia faecis]MRN24666.1 hypothetical protein [Romboutsia ilealis]
MKENIKVLDLDIKKCEESLKLNNLLEMVIIIEEMIDKYKNQINFLTSLEKNNVWSYKKKDLEDLNEYLNEHKNKLTNEYKISALKEVFDDAMSEIESNTSLSIDKKLEVTDIINSIKDISFNSKSVEEKWEEIRSYINYISKEEFIIANNLLNLVSFVLKTDL